MIFLVLSVSVSAGTLNIPDHARDNIPSDEYGLSHVSKDVLDNIPTNIRERLNDALHKSAVLTYFERSNSYDMIIESSYSDSWVELKGVENPEDMSNIMFREPLLTSSYIFTLDNDDLIFNNSTLYLSRENDYIGKILHSDDGENFKVWDGEYEYNKTHYIIHTDEFSSFTASLPDTFHLVTEFDSWPISHKVNIFIDDLVTSIPEGGSIEFSFYTEQDDYESLYGLRGLMPNLLQHRKGYGGW